MTKFYILRLLKTKTKEVFQTDKISALKKECDRLGLCFYRKPYFFSSVRCEDALGNPYALTQSFTLKNGQSLITSPEKIAKLFCL